MSQFHRYRATALAAAGAAVLTFAAPAAAAIDRSGSVSQDKPVHTYTTPEKSGFVWGSDVSERVPACTPVLFDCDATLIEVKDDPLRLTFKTNGTPSPDPVFSDVDLHIYESDANGTQGALLGESTSPALPESVPVTGTRAKPGFYLMYIDWYFGRHAVDGTVTFTPNPPPPA